MKMIMIAMMIVVLMMNIHGHRKLRSSINYSARKIGRENERRRGSNFMTPVFNGFFFFVPKVIS
jgi:hypothetical protein